MNNYCDIDKTIACICNCQYKYFLNKANVIGVGLGYKIKRGFYNFQKCITVFVRKKVSLNELSSQDFIPEKYMNISTDVVECGKPMTCSLRGKIRPVLGGYSIGVQGLGAGTMGCLVGDSNNDYILTCNHVIAGNSPESKNNDVLQPATQYGGKIHRDTIANVYAFDKVIYNENNNFTDSAIAKTDREKSSIDIALIGSILGVNTPGMGENVKKVGATTELTSGIVRGRYATIAIKFLGKDAIFKNQIITSKMSDAGDSGGILLNKKREAIGLLMADTDTISIYNSIHAVLSRLNVHILRR
ncbi:trypsin-like peptidase domain-containing protein [Clostridium botulinum]|uniref:Trypsin-like serine protease n=1 Tax=Clostridium botulinum TaxID=1491 RepID=A0A9Q1UZX5_CLOBO|nr:trypsin-like peptidase domain-containing protein [Clostridium botulinum]AEB76103.1 conserved hypothetical protein [Clostridium botulinum BKT015925]KEI05488.1 hypothetical protein Y848_07305 [Clostridium botulinum C/D str. Sp77]KLU76572.1 hypothetical protein CBC3_02655 [Clostridium botulinum V891]KOA75957.1 hypothetical protein ADU77_09610 [Clostridium botulinum]KOA82892.1 hypothetical protein ADU75_11925 [Clostridium botulinum]